MRRNDLTPDCGACAALCCVAMPFDTSPAFAITKGADEPCRFLAPNHRCGIHANLHTRGFSGCATFDCFGAGQRVTRAFPHHAGPARTEAFRRQREVHELLYLATESLQLCPPSRPDLVAGIQEAIRHLDTLAADPASLDVDPTAVDANVRALLRAMGVALGGRHLLVILG